MSLLSSSPSSTVTVLETYRSSFRQTPLKQVEAYWTALLTEGGLPARSRIDPRALENVLDSVMVLERIAPGIARVRVAGARIAEAAGMEPRGLPLGALFASGSRNRLSDTLEAVFSGPATATCDLSCGSVAGRMILLPLVCDAGRVGRTLGAVAFERPLPDGAPHVDLVSVATRPVFARPSVSPLAHAAETPAEYHPAPRFRVVTPND